MVDVAGSRSKRTRRRELQVPDARLLRHPVLRYEYARLLVPHAARYQTVLMDGLMLGLAQSLQALLGRAITALTSMSKMQCCTYYD